jgi:hypothetical protein
VRLLYVSFRSVRFLTSSLHALSVPNFVIPAEIARGRRTKVISVVKICPFDIKITPFDSSRDALSVGVFFTDFRARLHLFFRVTLLT